ncbi:DNA-directed RNA polymerases I and III subunit rpac1 isoform X2 [Gossypium hirsutum]|uniref:DNA-directed RNA polymerases I and III subunit rpac1 isoform X2 n=1 Tax=Gossypium hirsutum TaxID=3635 RepID=A0ABM2ZRA9_GOSHI|nr:DNA-directed RNA polymerases I and III subunit rpac1-like isoform X2 [Gossypium hirsutum]
MAEGAGEEKKKFSIWDLPDVPMGQLPPHLELQRSRVSCNKDAPIHIESIQYFGAYASMGIDNSSRLDRFSNNFRVEVVRLNEDDMEFDMIGSYMVNWSPKLQTAVSDLWSKTCRI